MVRLYSTLGEAVLVGLGRIGDVDVREDIGVDAPELDARLSGTWSDLILGAVIHRRQGITSASEPDRQLPTKSSPWDS